MISRNKYPTVGFAGETEVSKPLTAAPSAWAVVLATSVASAATGWVIEEIASSVRRKRKKR